MYATVSDAAFENQSPCHRQNFCVMLIIIKSDVCDNTSKIHILTGTSGLRTTQKRK